LKNRHFENEERFMIFGKHINRYYIKYGWMLLLGILALVVVDIGQLEVPRLYRMVVNGMNTGAVTAGGVVRAFDMEFLLDEVCRPLIVVICLIVAGRFLWRVCFFGAAIKVETDLRDRMFDHCRSLSQQYYQVNKVGNLMSLFTNDLETVQDCYGNGVLMFADALCLGSLAFVKMLRMNGMLTALSLIPMAFLFLAGSIVGKTMSSRWETRQEAFSLLSDFSQESFSGIAVIKAFAKETKELLAFQKLNKENEDANVNYTKISTLLQVVITLFVESVVCVILGYGGWLVHQGVFNAGEMIEFIGYFTAIVWPIEAVALLIEMSAKGKASLKRISELLDAPVDVCDRFSVDDNGCGDSGREHGNDNGYGGSGREHGNDSRSSGAPALQIHGDIEFRDLTFTYPGNEQPALEHISFSIKAGENVGIIGRTGAGKTTLVDLLVRTYNVPDNSLFVDGIDVNSLPIEGLRRHIAYVPQDNFLFSDTIANNIAFAFEDSEDAAAIERAARLSDVHDNIMEFPEKYQTLLGERGVTVSGGQKQRISIARALMKDAKILILDDSVSAVDTKTERVILDNLRTTREGLTTILIAHRISTIEKMDKIIFLEDGKLVDAGTHAELVARCPAYEEMVRLQKLEDLRKENEAHA
jgi:ATP-binding cassette subfamily B protein